MTVLATDDPQQSASSRVCAGSSSVPDRLDHAARFVVDAAAAPQFAGVVIGIARRAAFQPQPAGGQQFEDILRMVDDADTVEPVLLAEDFQADRARGDERADAVPAEELRVVTPSCGAPSRVSARKFERPAAADPAVAVGPPHLLAGSREVRSMAVIVRGVSSVMQPRNSRPSLRLPSGRVP